MQALHDADEVSTQKRGGHLMSPFDNSSCIASDDIPKALKSSLKNAGLVNALFLTVAVTGLMVGQADDPIDKAIKEGKWPHYFRHLYYFFWCNAYFMFISATMVSMKFLDVVHTVPQDNTSAVHLLLELGWTSNAHLWAFLVGLLSLCGSGAMWYEAASQVERFVYPCALPCFGVGLGGIIYCCTRLNTSVHTVMATRRSIQRGEPSFPLAQGMKQVWESYRQAKGDNTLLFDKGEFILQCSQQLLPEAQSTPSAFRAMAERIFDEHVDQQIGWIHVNLKYQK